MGGDRARRGAGRGRVATRGRSRAVAGSRQHDHDECNDRGRGYAPRHGGQIRIVARPTTVSMGTGPNTRLSVLVPGAGHIYAGRSGAGVAWMATTLAGYACCLLPGLFLHGLCLVSAAHTREVQ